MERKFSSKFDLESLDANASIASISELLETRHNTRTRSILYSHEDMSHRFTPDTITAGAHIPLKSKLSTTPEKLFLLAVERGDLPLVRKYGERFFRVRMFPF